VPEHGRQHQRCAAIGIDDIYAGASMKERLSCACIIPHGRVVEHRGALQIYHQLKILIGRLAGLAAAVGDAAPGKHPGRRKEAHALGIHELIDSSRVKFRHPLELDQAAQARQWISCRSRHFGLAPKIPFKTSEHVCIPYQVIYE
jgi:hypothetical protein